MKKTHLVRTVILALSIFVLSGCLLVPVDDGFGPGDSRGRSRGGHQGDHRDRYDGPGDHR